MALARVVTFEGVSKDRMDEMKREMSEGDRPEGMPASEIVVLHDADTEKSLVILFFETEDDYTQGDAVQSRSSSARYVPRSASSKKPTTRRSYSCGRASIPPVCAASGISQICFGAPAAA